MRETTAASVETAARLAAYGRALEAFAVGDALGMAGEFMTREDIVAGLAGRGGLVEGFVEPALSHNHGNLGRASITDDTEQNLWLLEAYSREGRVSAEISARALLSWVRETGAVEKKYIGPSSLAALRRIEDGVDPRSAGLGGRTCGAIMRTPAAALFAMARGQSLEDCVVESCLPTHNSSTALEAAMAYAFALRAAFLSPSREAGRKDVDAILAEACAGAHAGIARAPYAMCAPSIEARLFQLRRTMERIGSPGELLDFLYGVLGTGLESADVGAAVFGIFMYAKDDVWLALRMGASVGGDTDTIAALSGALCAAYAGGHNIPSPILEEALRVNNLDLMGVCRDLDSPRAG